MTSTPQVALRLPDRTCIEVSGEDAETFLRNQLTTNPPTDNATSHLSAWLDARGRVLAIFHVVVAHNAWLLVAPVDLAPALVTRMQRFVLRLKVKVALRDDLAVSAGDDGHIDVEPQSGTARGTPTTPDASARDTNAAALNEIRRGIPAIGSALSGRYVAQMLNLDLLGALAFDKGCYPGQEIVARIKYRGEVKRRLARFETTAIAVIDTPVLDGAGAQAGEVIRIVRTATGSELLAVIRREALEGAPLYLAVDGHPALRRLPLPYERLNPLA